MRGTCKQINYTYISSLADALLLGCVDELASAPWLMSSLSDLHLNWSSREALLAHLLPLKNKNCRMQLTKLCNCVKMQSIQACLPLGQPGRAVESVLRQSAFLQTDTPRKHAPSEACCSRCTHMRGPRSVSLLPFRIGLHAFTSAKTASPTHFLSRRLSCRFFLK